MFSTTVQRATKAIMYSTFVITMARSPFLWNLTIRLLEELSIHPLDFTEKNPTNDHALE